MTKLKRCPFCGGEAEIETTDKNGWIFYYAQCNKCNIGTYDSTTNLKEVIDLWNTRTPEIVRCEECKHSFSRDGRKPYGCYLHGKNKVTLHLAEDFCSYGERRKEDE